MIKDTQNFDLIFEDIWVFDEPLVDNLDTSFRVGRLLECGLINGAISTSSNGLNDLMIYLMMELVDGLDVFLPGLDEEIFANGCLG